MYEGAKTRVRTTVGNTDFFPVKVGVHQGSAISPYLFTLILDELSTGIQEDIPWCMIFAHDIVLIAESAKGLNNRFESWRKALEDNSLLVSREKTEYLRCDFGRYEVVHQEMNISIGDRILQPKESFRCLDSVIHRSGRIDDDVVHRIRAGVLADHESPSGEGGSSGIENVEGRPRNAPVRRVEAMEVEGSRRRGRPKLRWKDRLKMDMKELILSEDMTSDRNALLMLLVALLPCRCFFFYLKHQSLCTRTLVGGLLEAVSLLSGYPGSRGRICLHFTFPVPCSGGIGYVVVGLYRSFKSISLNGLRPSVDGF
nr:hypothetical protein [Tanacetum cinerariifolium]